MNNFMRPGQNRNRNRNRNRHRGGGGGGGGGSGGNKVFDSNGPDVKVRGTAQTIAEKYMQLGRDAQSSGDTVSAESYYQHAEHYYRVWAANQPPGSSLIMSRRLGEEEVEEENAAPEEGGDDEGAEGQPVESAEGGEAPQGEGQPQQQDGQQQRQFNNNRNDRNDRNGRERFRPRWQRGRDRNQQQDGNPEQVAATGAEPTQQQDQPQDAGQWEAPSFLQRPSPAPAAEGEVEPRRSRPRRERSEPADENAPGE